MYFLKLLLSPKLKEWQLNLKIGPSADWPLDWHSGRNTWRTDLFSVWSFHRWIQRDGRLPCSQHLHTFSMLFNVYHALNDYKADESQTGNRCIIWIKGESWCWIAAGNGLDTRRRLVSGQWERRNRSIRAGIFHGQRHCPSYDQLPSRTTWYSLKKNKFFDFN